MGKFGENILRKYILRKGHSGKVFFKKGNFPMGKNGLFIED